MIDEPVLERREEMEADENEQRVSEQLVRFLGQLLQMTSLRFFIPISMGLAGGRFA